MLPIGGGVGKLVTAVAAALLLRLFSGPGPVILPENEEDDDERNGEENGEAPPNGKVSPVTIRWTDITCSLSDNSFKSVSLF